MIRPIVALLLAAALLPAATAQPAAADGFQLIPIGNFDSPVYVASHPSRPRQLFVVEQTGQIQILRDEARLPDPFLDIRDIVGTGGERGLLSMAFAPDYGTTRRFYVAFTNNEGAIELDEFHRAANSKVHADRSTRRILLTIPHADASNHNGGQLQFGPDGFLYLSTGDGGEVFPRGETSRSLSSLLGKILRINPLAKGDKPYTIPKSNPYLGRKGRNEIYAYGLRNPWRFSFDGDRLIVADVGQGSWEEVNFMRVEDASGVNFGWPQYEGKEFFDEDRPGPDPAIPPMFVYNHEHDRCAVTGGYVVRDPNLPTLVGRYLYADYCGGRLRSFIPKVGSQHARDDKWTGVTAHNLGGFGVGAANQIYVTQISGAVSRLAPMP